MMESLQYMEEMNVPSNLRLVATKLPYRLWERWRAVACEIQECRGCRVIFPDLVNFIERQVKILSDPLFGNIQETQPHNSVKHQVMSKFLSKERCFATVAAVNTSADIRSTEQQAHSTSTPSMSKSVLCCACRGGHTLEQCAQLKKMTHRERIDLFRKNGICFGCLKPGHTSNVCKNRITCSVCNLKHPTILHITAKPKTSEEQPLSSALVSQQTCARTGAGKQDHVLSIVPVQVKAKSGNNILETYAFLDPGSSATFCTEHLMRKLNLNGTKTSIFLRTMGQENTVNTLVLTELEVCSYNGDLPDVHTQKNMPVTKDNIVTQENMASSWKDQSSLPWCWGGLADWHQRPKASWTMGNYQQLDPMPSEPYWGGL